MNFGWLNDFGFFGTLCGGLGDACKWWGAEELLGTTSGQRYVIDHSVMLDN